MRPVHQPIVLEIPQYMILAISSHIQKITSAFIGSAFQLARQEQLWL